MNQPSILIADLQIISRSGIHYLVKTIIPEASITETNNLEELFARLNEHCHDLVIIDFDSFDLNDLSELREIKKQCNISEILVITDNQDKEDVLAVLDYGINNYILKTCDEKEFEFALKASLSRQKYFCKEVVDILLNRNSSQAKPTEKLTSSEIEIVKLIGQGLTTKVIAARKNLSFHTIITHRKNIFRKLGINNTSELIMQSIKMGLIDTIDYSI